MSLYRIYRDTRFSADKSPLKSHVAAHFPSRGLARNEGAALYLEVAPARVWIGGGLYMPTSSDLRLIRAHIATSHRTLHRIVTGAPFRRAVGALDGAQLAGMPRGYLVDHPAAEYLRFKQFLAGRQFEADFAITDRFYSELLRMFRAVAPLVRLPECPAPRRETARPEGRPLHARALGTVSQPSLGAARLTQILSLPDGGRLPDLRQSRRRPAAAASKR